MVSSCLMRNRLTIFLLTRVCKNHIKTMLKKIHGLWQFGNRGIKQKFYLKGTYSQRPQITTKNWPRYPHIKIGQKSRTIPTAILWMVDVQIVKFLWKVYFYRLTIELCSRRHLLQQNTFTMWDVSIFNHSQNIWDRL